MKRESRQQTQPKPVEKVELSEKHVKLRIVLFAVFVLIAIGAIAIGLVRCLSVDSGWYEITAEKSANSCASEFSFTYYVDDGMGRSGKNDLQSKYTELCEKAYKQFSASAFFDGVNNLARIGFERNNEVTVSPELYAALKLITDGGSRYVYRAPIYSIYRNLFTCLDDISAREFDPYYNAELAAEITQLMQYNDSKSHVEMEFKDNNVVRLFVSDEYYSFAVGHDVGVFLDMFALENAFMLDYVADGLIASGYTNGMIASRDGYARDLNAASEGSNAVVYDVDNTTLYAAAQITFKNNVSIVSLNMRSRNAPFGHYYVYADGTCRTPFIGEDGLNVAAAPNFLAYSYEKSCAAVAVKAVEAYCSSELIETQTPALKAAGVYTAYCEDRIIYYNDSTINIAASVFDDRTYSAQLAE